MVSYSEILPQVLADYPLAVVHHEHVRTSENVVVKLQSEDGRFYALRIRRIRGSCQQEQLMSELVFLHDLHEHTGTEIPTPVATRSGRLFCRITVDGDTYMCTVFTWVAGVHVGANDVTLLHMASMARAVALLHRFSFEYRPPEGFVRPVYDEEWFFGANSWSTDRDFTGRLTPADTAYLLTFNKTLHAHMRNYPKNADSFGLIHYDLHVGNFLFHKTSATMIDFDECGFGYYLFDLAHILFEFIDHPEFEAFRKAAIEQYTAIGTAKCRPDRDIELFLGLQGVAYVNWLHRIFRRDGNEDALRYWIPLLVQRLKRLQIGPFCTA